MMTLDKKFEGQRSLKSSWVGGMFLYGKSGDSCEDIWHKHHKGKAHGGAEERVDGLSESLRLIFKKSHIFV